MSANLDHMISTNLLNRLDVRVLCSVLRHENKTVSSEEVVIRSITNWAKYMEQSTRELYRINHFSGLCNLVNWTKITPISILNLLVNERDHVIREEFAKAVQGIFFHASKTLYAVGCAESGVAVVQFDYDKPEESALLGHVEGQANSRTVLFKGVLFVIGGDGVEFRNRVSTFDLVTREKGQVADLGVGRVAGHSVATSSGEIFVCGGRNDEKASLKTCEAFHPGRNQWRRIRDLQQDRSGLAVAFLPDGRLLATGGVGVVVYSSDDDDIGDFDVNEKLSTCELLNTATPFGNWQPVAAMQQPRCSHGAVYFQGLVFVAGGRGLTSCEFFTPPPLGSTTELGQWTRILSKMTRSFGWIRSIVVLSANEILVFGNIKREDGLGVGEVERFKKNSISFPEMGDFGAWSWTPLPRVDLLRRGLVSGVHSAN